MLGSGNTGISHRLYLQVSHSQIGGPDYYASEINAVGQKAGVESLWQHVTHSRGLGQRVMLLAGTES